MNIVEYTEFLFKSISKEKDLITVKKLDENDNTINILVLVPENEMGFILGISGKNIKSLRCLIDAYSYLHDKKKVKIDVQSF